MTLVVAFIAVANAEVSHFMEGCHATFQKMAKILRLEEDIDVCELFLLHTLLLTNCALHEYVIIVV